MKVYVTRNSCREAKPCESIKTNSCLIVLIAVIVLTISIGAYRLKNADQEVGLPSAEVRLYEGKDLSSVDDFRENSIKGPQRVNLEFYRLSLKGLVSSPRNYTYEEVVSGNQRYKKVVRLSCVEGWDVTILWEGILIKDLLLNIGYNGSARVVIFRSYDGYSTSLPLDYLIANNILIAYKMNNVTLPAERGFPFQLVAESKWGYKWIKWITEKSQMM